MSKRKPIDPKQLKVGDIVEWVEQEITIVDGVAELVQHPDVWDVEVRDIRNHGILVDAGYGKTALFSPSSEDPTKYTLLVGSMEMSDYIRNRKKS